jgi:hypothetical protein
LRLIERIAQELAGPICDRPYASVRREAADILSEAFDVVEWRFGIVIPWKVERLAVELARHHRGQRLKNVPFAVDDKQGKLCL